MRRRIRGHRPGQQDQKDERRKRKRGAEREWSRPHCQVTAISQVRLRDHNRKSQHPRKKSASANSVQSKTAEAVSPRKLSPMANPQQKCGKEQDVIERRIHGGNNGDGKCQNKSQSDCEPYG